MNETSCFLVLTCNPASPILTNDTVDAIRDHLDASPVWLQEGVACEIPCRLDDVPLPALRERFSSLPVDFNLVAAEDRRKDLLVADMESTIIEQECLDDLAGRLNLRAEISDITNRAMRGDIAFEPALRERVSLLAGLPVQSLQDVYDAVTLMPGAGTLLATLKHHGVFCGLVSGGFSFFADKIAALLDFDACQCNRLETSGGRLTGRVIEPVLGRAAKAEKLQSWCDGKNMPLSRTLAVGDGSNDLDMLNLAGMGVAFRAKPPVAEAAAIRIDHGDLTALLHLQGYRAGEIITRS